VFVRNVTDVDDKIIARALELNEKPETVAARYLARYHETMDRLGIGRPDIEPKATGHVEAMLDLISKLVLDNVAYEAKGDVYFSVRKFAAYGKLSNRALDELQAGARVEPGEHPGPTAGAGKQDPLDFALWKAAKPGEPSWESPWGQGRPGWHIECSAMSMKYLGDTFDIHGGGVDLVFPHHENEIAQARAVGKPFAKYWIHNGLLTVKGEKMSKSLGNYITVNAALQECGGEIDGLKVFFLGAHYRSPVDYTNENLKAAMARLRRWRYLFGFVEATTQPVDFQTAPGDFPKLLKEFEQVMDDDLNTPAALGVLDKFANLGYQTLGQVEAIGLAWTDNHPHMRLARHNMELVVSALRQFGGILGLFNTYQPVMVTAEIKQLAQAREEARKRKDFQTADNIRKEIENRGFIIADSAGGSVILPKQEAS
jgi:cysteinyl-tRNA synthetase